MILDEESLARLLEANPPLTKRLGKGRRAARRPSERTPKLEWANERPSDWNSLESLVCAPDACLPKRVADNPEWF